MKQKNIVWTTISLDLYDKIKNFQEDNSFSTATKVMLYILKNHSEIKEDFQYNSKISKTLMMTVDSDTRKEIEIRADAKNVSISKYVRGVLYSYFNGNKADKF